MLLNVVYSVEWFFLAMEIQCIFVDKLHKQFTHENIKKIKDNTHVKTSMAKNGKSILYTKSNMNGTGSYNEIYVLLYAGKVYF